MGLRSVLKGLKRLQQNNLRLIIDLSHPKTHSVNDGISKASWNLLCITIDDAIHSFTTETQLLVSKD